MRQKLHLLNSSPSSLKKNDEEPNKAQTLLCKAATQDSKIIQTTQITQDTIMGQVSKMITETTIEMKIKMITEATTDMIEYAKTVLNVATVGRNAGPMEEEKKDKYHGNSTPEDLSKMNMHTNQLHLMMI